VIHRYLSNAQLLFSCRVDNWNGVVPYFGCLLVTSLPGLSLGYYDSNRVSLLQALTNPRIHARLTSSFSRIGSKGREGGILPTIA